MDAEHGPEHALVDVDGGEAVFQHLGKFGNVCPLAAARHDQPAGVFGDTRAHFVQPFPVPARVEAEQDLALQIEHGAQVEGCIRLGVVQPPARDQPLERFDGKHDADLALQAFEMFYDLFKAEAALGHVDGFVCQEVHARADGSGIDHADVAPYLLRRKAGGRVGTRQRRREHEADDVAPALDEGAEGGDEVVEGGLRRFAQRLPRHQGQKVSVAVGRVFFVKVLTDLVIDGHLAEDAAAGDLRRGIPDRRIGDDSDHISPPMPARRAFVRPLARRGNVRLSSPVNLSRTQNKRAGGLKFTEAAVARLDELFGGDGLLFCKEGDDLLLQTGVKRVGKAVFGDDLLYGAELCQIFRRHLQAFAGFGDLGAVFPEDGSAALGRNDRIGRGFGDPHLVCRAQAERAAAAAFADDDGEGGRL